MADQLQVTPTPPGALARFLSPHGGAGGSAVAAFVVGAAGTAAFVASLTLDWQRVRLDDYQDIFRGQTGINLDMHLGLYGTGMVNFSLVYMLGALALIVMLGSVLTRPDQALRLRMGAAGLGVGLAGVLVAMLSRLKDTIFGLSALGIFSGVDQATVSEVLRDATISYEPGFFCAIAAVVLLPVGFFLAAGRPSRAAALAAQTQLASPVAPAAPPVQSGPPAPDAVGLAPPNGGHASSPVVPAPGKPGYVGDLTVTAADAIDPGTETDVWRR